MQKYKKAAINIAFLTIIFTTGLSGNYADASNEDVPTPQNNSSQAEQIDKQHETIISAIEDNDYQAWKKITDKKTNFIGQDDFKSLVKARQAARNGDYDKAILITEQLKKELLKNQDN